MSSRRGQLMVPRRVTAAGGAPTRAPLGAFCLLALCVALAGCQNLCVRHSDCPVGYLCAPSGLCEFPPPPPAVDASTGGPSGIPGLPDGSFDETGEPDAATPDASTVDAAPLPPDDS